MRIIESSEEPTMRGCAIEAGISERTIYRYFPSFDDLGLALTPEFMTRSTVALPESFDALSAYAHELFTTFDQNQALITAMTDGKWMRPYLAESRRKNLTDLQQLIDKDFPNAPVQQRQAAAESLRVVLSGTGWVYLRISCAIPNDEVIGSAVWLIETVTERLKT